MSNGNFCTTGAVKSPNLLSIECSTPNLQNYHLQQNKYEKIAKPNELTENYLNFRSVLKFFIYFRYFQN